MIRRMLLLTVLCLGWLATPAAAQAPRAPGGWSVGAVMLAIDSPYAGEDSRVRAFPFLAFEGERFYLRGIEAGWRVAGGEAWRIDLGLAARLDGFDADDLGRAELAARGIDRDLLADRDDGVDLALGLDLDLGPTRLALDLRHDLAGASEGSEAALRWSLPRSFGRTRLGPYLGARWLSSDLADYYYGILDEEVARGVDGYRPGSATVFELGVELSRGFADDWFLFGDLGWSRLPGALADSPLVADDSEARLILGLGRRF